MATKYRTLASGKHHSTQNLFDMGFYRYFGLRDGACNYFNQGEQRPGEPVPGDKNPPGGKKRIWCIDENTYMPYTPKEKDFYTTDHNGHIIDIMATVIDITGAKYPRELRGESIVPYEGESLVPVFNETEHPRKKPLFWQWKNGKAIMKDNWNLVSKKKGGKDKWELFDMETDKTETVDLLAKHPKVVSELKSLHEEWLIYCARE